MPAPPLLASCAAAFAIAAVLYYRGAFRTAGAAGVAFWAGEAWLLLRDSGPALALPLLVLFGLLPALALAVHAVDARKGIFLLPTIYAIPLAFAAGVLLWLASAAVVVAT